MAFRRVKKGGVVKKMIADGRMWWVEG